MRSRDFRDALCWSFLSALVFLLLPIGHVSPDGLGQSHNFSSGFSLWNPNHLLVEPLGAWWMSLGASREDGVDHLRRLSILAGSVAAGLFRFGVASRLAPSRLAANHATAWLAFSSAFARLWVMDEVYMVQMPAVVGVAWLFLRYLERPSVPRSLAAGLSVTLAAAFFIESLLLGPALVLALWKRPKHAAGTLIGTLATVPVFAAAWASSPTPHGFLDWMTRYGGGSVPARVEAAYGMTDLFVSTARALYGAACALVDLTPLVVAFRDQQMDLTVPLRAAAFLAACCALLFVRDRTALLLAGIWATAVLAFGIYWNNSDDQFYVQLAVAFGALGARLRGKAVVLGMIALLWNVVDVGHRRVLYPRQERLATIERLGEAGLIVYPGFDEMEVLLELKPVAPAVSMTSYSVRLPPEEGLKDLSATILDTLRKGRSVAVVDVMDVSPSRPPWKFLKRMGYDHAKVVDTLDSFALERSQERVGPFTVRWIR